ncbi:MAG: TadE/TadG family type IV pilus assembly protein, partial [Sphingomicrobium sp.]
MNALIQCIRDRRGGAGAEMALVIPLLLIILVGSIETGNYFYNEHKLVEGARNGARYAARQRFSNYSACSGTVGGTVYADTKLMVRKGTLDSTANDLLPNWADAATVFDVTMTCQPALANGSGGNYVLGGIYANASSGAPTVLVSASLPYRPLFGAFGFTGLGFKLNATQTAAVMGL